MRGALSNNGGVLLSCFLGQETKDKTIMTDGFVKVAAATPKVKVADVTFNTTEIEGIMARAEGQGIEILCFPELSLTAYSCQDLFGQQVLLEEAESGLLRVMELSRNLSLTVIVGLPFSVDGILLNCAAVVQGGKVHGLVPKTFLPNYKEFYEQRWFASATALAEGSTIKFCGQNIPVSPNLIFTLGDLKFCIEICEDLWAPIPPSTMLALKGADIIFNLSASNDVIGKHTYLRSLVEGQSARTICGYIYASCGFGESTQDLVYGGKAIIAENGHILAESQRFVYDQQITIAEIDVEKLRSERRQNTTFAKSVETHAKFFNVNCISIANALFSRDDTHLTRTFNPLPFVPSGEELNARCEEILCIQSEGLATRIAHTHAKNVVVGISGGLDSTLALLVCVNAFDRLGLDRHGIVGITMPGFGTTDRTYTNAVSLMKSLGITIREINIAEAVNIHFRDLGHNPAIHDVTYENCQARERTQILMDVANQVGGFVVGTGDLSELALGWATYNGDHMSMYGVNTSIPKTLIRHLVNWVALNVADEQSCATLLDIIDTPISPELIPADENGNITQKTEDLVGPYELHDFFLYYTLRFGFRPGKIYRMALRAFDGHDGGPTYSDATIKKWISVFFRRFFNQQFKRSCLPDGPKVGSCTLSPRGDWRMPSDASSAEWLKECEALSSPTLF